MTVPTIIRHPTLSCEGCELLHRDAVFLTHRGLFFHLLWHRDSGHVVSKELLDEFDPAGPVENLGCLRADADPRGRSQTGGLSGSYGESHQLHVPPEHFGAARGRLARLSRGKSVDGGDS